ncbi:hypothetical protein MOBT1_002038 [Malassezia obtusa]|uniref:Cytochrome c oxidase assembly factor 3 n=1 Tax=Malassezia obtusa TaxID=76774 RepID=A0AAF0ITM2_9BASI|nr:hypothetical protein MOBT1_002038 [Malassezia obtusa]
MVRLLTFALMREINQAQSTYHPSGFGNSAGYKRARKPYFVGNMLTFAALCAFVTGVYSYSIMMVCFTLTQVEQDDFSDIENIRVMPENMESTPEREKEIEVVPSGPESGAHPATTLVPPLAVKPEAPVAVSAPEMNKKLI